MSIVASGLLTAAVALVVVQDPTPVPDPPVVASPVDPPVAPLPLTERISTGQGDVFAVATAQLDGRPVVVTGGDSYYANSGGDSTVRVWDLDTGEPIGQPLTGHDGSVHAVATARLEGRPVIVSGGGDGTVRVWDLASGEPIGQPLTGHNDDVYGVATTELDGRPVIVAGSTDLLADTEDTIRVWDLTTGTQIGQTLTGHTDQVRSVTTAQLDGRPVIVSGSIDQTVRVWDLATGAPIGQPLAGYTGDVLAVTTAQLDGRPVIISGNEDNTVRVWDLATGDPIGRPFTGHSDYVWAAATTEFDGRPVVVTSSQDIVLTWDLAARVRS